MSMRFLFLGLALVACNGDTGETDAEDPGAAIFANSCSACHGTDGSGVDGVGPDLSTKLAGKTAADVEDIVTNGTGNMAAISGLSAQQTTDVAAYVVSEWGD